MYITFSIFINFVGSFIESIVTILVLDGGENLFERGVDGLFFVQTRDN